MYQNGLSNESPEARPRHLFGVCFYCFNRNVTEVVISLEAFWVLWSLIRQVSFFFFFSVGI